MSKKALNFDLSDVLLRKYYPSKNYKKAWSDIKYFLIKGGFRHRQYSGYVSKKRYFYVKNYTNYYKNV